jgi:SAM-dependent methyltransferase
MTHREIHQKERPGSWAEIAARRIYSGIVYFRIYRRLHPDRPHYTPGAIARLETVLDRASSVFEWGSGVSTVWYSRRVASITSIEHDVVWFEKVTGWLRGENAKGAALRHVPDESGWFLAYSRAILEFPDSSFDLIAIDGRARVACAQHAVAKLKPGGILLLDDSQRPRYRSISRLFPSAHARVFDCGLLQTTLFETNKALVSPVPGGIGVPKRVASSVG